MRVLLLEDDRELNALAAMQIARRGHEVFAAETLGEAVEVIQEHARELDCIVADHRLPDGHGAEFCIECQEKYPHLIIGIVSARLTPVDREILAAAKIPCWPKPVLYNEVVDALVAQQPLREHRADPRVPPADAPVLDLPLVAEAQPRLSGE